MLGISFVSKGSVTTLTALLILTALSTSFNPTTCTPVLVLLNPSSPLPTIFFISPRFNGTPVLTPRQLHSRTQPLPSLAASMFTAILSSSVCDVLGRKNGFPQARAVKEARKE